MQILSAISGLIVIGIWIGLFVTWIQYPELTWMQMFLKYLLYGIIAFALLIIRQILLFLDN